MIIYILVKYSLKNILIYKSNDIKKFIVSKILFARLIKGLNKFKILFWWWIFRYFRKINVI